MTFKIKSTEQYITVLVFVMMYKAVLTFYSMDLILSKIVTIHLKPLQHYFYMVLINLLQDTYKPNPWYFPHNFDIAAKEKVQQLTLRIEKKGKIKIWYA